MTALSADAQWPDYRGPRADGWVVDAQGKVLALPSKWNEKSGVSWKVKLPRSGWSTPVLEDGRLWMTGASSDGKVMDLYAVDASDGKLLLNRTLLKNKTVEALGNPVNGYASPSAVVKDERVYVHFGTYGTFCLDTKTHETVWERLDIHCRHFRGPGSSPLLYKNLLILTMDGIDVQFITALNAATGETIWKTARSVPFNDLDAAGQPRMNGDYRKAYGTPLIIGVNGSDVLVSTGAKAAYGHDPRTGKEKWQVRFDEFSSASRPVHDDGIVVVNTGYPKAKLIAIRPDGRGNVTDTHVAWTYDSSVCRRASPLVVDGRFYMISDNGILTCLNMPDGKKLWKGRLPGNFTASPVYAGGKLYFMNEEGTCYVLEPGDTLNILGQNRLDEGMMASPAAGAGALYLRSRTHLYRIGS